MAPRRSTLTLGASAEYQQAQGGVHERRGQNRHQRSRATARVLGPDALTSRPIKLPCDCPLGGDRVQVVHPSRLSTSTPAVRSKDRLWFFTGVTNSAPGGPARRAGDARGSSSTRSPTQQEGHLEDQRQADVSAGLLLRTGGDTVARISDAHDAARSDRLVPRGYPRQRVGADSDPLADDVLTGRYVVHYMPEGTSGSAPA